ncbi:12616_t:CDS:1 [Acaulospora colombiana]|uniref:12616_t:CDS:1 n=1 Tax=Acaulospora colombiana TaxID=27376 RepID=A0ACA9MTZ9_9GLOM|nr:12616_t:CDS:1 [Acaulospora colombiana]
MHSLGAGSTLLRTKPNRDIIRESGECACARQSIERGFLALWLGVCIGQGPSHLVKSMLNLGTNDRASARLKQARDSAIAVLSKVEAPHSIRQLLAGCSSSLINTS